MGCALRIAIWLYDLKQVMSVSDIDKLLRRHQKRHNEDW